METNRAYQDKINEQLKQWNVLVTLLAEKVENAADDIKLRYIKQYDVLKLTQHEAATKIKDLESITGDAWNAAKVHANTGLHNFGSGLAKAITDFK